MICISGFAGDAPTSSETQTAAESNANRTWSSTVQEVMLSAISLSGIKYKFGGLTPETGFDCSGFVRYVFQQAANLTLPHGARALSQLGQTVTQDNLQPGDLVFFNTLKSSFSHVGIYLGNNRFIHSPSPGQSVSIMSMNDSYWSKRFNGARRLTSAQSGALSIKDLSQPTPAE
jgi:cell wall-associated NlpC family hydrolase